MAYECSHGAPSSPRWQTPDCSLPTSYQIAPTHSSVAPQQQLSMHTSQWRRWSASCPSCTMAGLQAMQTCLEFRRYVQQPPQPNQPLPPHLLAPTLAELFTAIMTSGDVPVDLALVTPCHKRGRKDGSWSCGGRALRQLSELFFSLAKAFCHHWRAFSITGTGSLGSALAAVWHSEL